MVRIGFYASNFHKKGKMKGYCMVDMRSCSLGREMALFMGCEELF